MHIIGLTGGIASGKSTVSKLLRQRGAYIVDADAIAREIVEPGKPALREIQEAFGKEALLPDGSLNRKKVGDIVFRSDEARKKMNDITHARIKLEINKAVEKAAGEGYNIVVLDVPLLIEAGWNCMADDIWIVYIDTETQITRLMERDSLTREEALARIRSQMSLDEKKSYADIVIDNSGSLDKTRLQVEEALSSL